MGACIRSHEMTSPAAFAARPAFDHVDDIGRRDVDDAGLADEFESEIDWNRRHRANRRVDLRLHEGERNGFFPRLPEHVLIETGVAGGPLNDLRLVEAKPSARRPRSAPGSRAGGRPVPARADRSSASPSRRSLQALIVLADQRREARARRGRGKPCAPGAGTRRRARRRDAATLSAPKAEKAREQGMLRLRSSRASGRSRFCRNDKAFASRARSAKISDDRIEVEIFGLRRPPTMVAKAGQHFVHAVRGRRKADLVEKDAGEIVARGEAREDAASFSRARPDCWGRRSGTSPRLRRPSRPSLPSRGCARRASSRQGPTSVMSSMSESALYQRYTLSTGRCGPQNLRNTSGASRKPTISRSRSSASSTRRTQSNIRCSSSAAGDE